MQPISYQLYSSRNFPPLPETLSMLAGMGYSQVEGYGALYAALDDVGAMRAALDAAGLTMPSAHFGLDMVEDDPANVIAIAQALGINAVFVPHLVEELRPDSDAGWSAFGQRLEEAGKPLQDAGLTFGWHNHDFEFSTNGGAHPLDLILSGGASLALEFDVAWAARAGQEPGGWINKYAGRIHAAHVKDIAPAGDYADEDGWADVGQGTMDWKRHLAELADAGCKLVVMEHDNPNDHARFAQRSIDFMKSL